jgi:type I restriction enzyme M protein
MGGIPQRDLDALERYWQVYPALRNELFEPAERPGYSNLKVPKEAIKTTIFSHPEFTAYSTTMDAAFDAWKRDNYALLSGIDAHTHPNDVIHTLSESLLAHYTGKALIDPYDIYQHLLDYWTETLKDDVYMLVEDGWKATLEPVRDSKGNPRKGEFDCELIPKPLMIARYFADEQAALNELEQQLETTARNLEEMLEEHGSEDGLLSEALNDKGKVTKATLSARMKDIKRDPEYADEYWLLEQYQSDLEQEVRLKTAIKDAQAALDRNVIARYPKLSAEEIKTLVIDDKWLTAIQAAIQGEIDAISQRLTQRITELAERYECTLPVLEREVQALTEKVSGHLEKMGVVWN